MTKATTLVEQEVNPATANPMIEVDGFKLKKLSVISTFSDTKKIDKAIKKFREDALSIVPDLSTGKSRDAIASVAFKISKKKTSIVSKMIDPSIEDAKALVKNVNAGKKHFQTEMDILRDEVRKPLNDWEAEEKVREEKRIATIKEKIEGIAAIVTFDPSNPPGKDEIASLLEAVDGISCEEGFDEFAQDALQAKARAKEILTEALNTIIQQELKEAAEEELRLKELELEKQKLKQKAQELKQQAQERVNKLAMIPVGLFGKTSHEIRKKITSLDNYEVPEAEFGELFETAKTSVANVITQLNGMLQQQILVEQAQQQAAVVEEKPVVHVDMAEGPGETVYHQQEAPEAIQQQEKPVEQRLADRFANTGSVEQVPETKRIPEQGRTHSCTELTPLTWHQKMIKQVDFWYNENGSYDNLMSILNQYK